MNKKLARDALDIYKKFLIRMDRVADFLKVAEVRFFLILYDFYFKYFSDWICSMFVKNNFEKDEPTWKVKNKNIIQKEYIGI